MRAYSDVQRREGNASLLMYSWITKWQHSQGGYCMPWDQIFKTPLYHPLQNREDRLRKRLRPSLRLGGCLFSAPSWSWWTFSRVKAPGDLCITQLSGGEEEAWPKSNLFWWLKNIEKPNLVIFKHIWPKLYKLFLSIFLRIPGGWKVIEGYWAAASREDFACCLIELVLSRGFDHGQHVRWSGTTVAYGPYGSLEDAQCIYRPTSCGNLWIWHGQNTWGTTVL